jgi:hypothetical protein
MDYRIAIPSYKRPDTIRKKTLHYLLDLCKISPSIIDVFVADEKEYEDYKYLLDIGIRVIIGVPTLKDQRNFIIDYYNDNDFVVSFDDDIDGIYIKNESKSDLTIDIHKCIQLGFNNCIKNKTKIWGICAVNNGFYMDWNISTNLKYIVGCFWGQIIDHSSYLKVTLEDKEDFERSILYFHRFGKVVRLNMYAPKTNYYGEQGGMQETRTENRVTESAYYLAGKYPEYCSLNTKKKSNHTEIKLNSRAIAKRY